MGCIICAYAYRIYAFFSVALQPNFGPWPPPLNFPIIYDYTEYIAHINLGLYTMWNFTITFLLLREPKQRLDIVKMVHTTQHVSEENTRSTRTKKTRPHAEKHRSEDQSQQPRF
jgi:hypothetical protein